VTQAINILHSSLLCKYLDYELKLAQNGYYAAWKVFALWNFAFGFINDMFLCFFILFCVEVGSNLLLVSI